LTCQRGQAVLASDLDQAVGLLMMPDRSVAYVNEQAGGGRIGRIECGQVAADVLDGLAARSS
jgi:hypothetical protein